MQKIEKIDNRLKNNRNTIIFTIISGISKVDDLKIKCCVTVAGRPPRNFFCLILLWLVIACAVCASRRKLLRLQHAEELMYGSCTGKEGRRAEQRMRVQYETASAAARRAWSCWAGWHREGKCMAAHTNSKVVRTATRVVIECR
jgi:hypothetical protein